MVPKQAIPVFADKVGKISKYIQLQLSREDLPIREMFVLARDQAWIKLAFFGGDRLFDLGQMKSQEVRSLPDGSGFLISHTFGKNPER